jgi:hypothetical protein
VDSFGDCLLQESFIVWDPKQLIKKGRDRHVFLFDLCVVFAKKTSLNDSTSNTQPNKFRYVYKSRLLVGCHRCDAISPCFQLAEINVTEHIEGDETKFALWTGQNVPQNDMRTIMKAPCHKSKICWVKKLRDLIGQRRFQFRTCTRLRAFTNFARLLTRSLMALVD